MKYIQSALVVALLVASSAAVRINPAKPTGLEPPPKDHQYDVPMQLKRPLNPVNTHSEDDFRTIYNPTPNPSPMYFG